MENSLAPVIHITGVQRSGHTFIGDTLTTNLGIAWWKQHAAEPWVVKVALREEWHGVHPALRSWFKVRGSRSLFSADETVTHLHPPATQVVGNKTIQDLRAVRVTEYRRPDWFFDHVMKDVTIADTNINVVRDPRNLLASAIGKGWDLEHCRDLLGACEFQYTDPTIKSFVNISYESVLTHLEAPGKHKEIGGIKINDWALSSIIDIQRFGGNSSFGKTKSSDEYMVRYKRPDIVETDIFKALMPKAEEIYNTHHVPFLDSLK